MFIPKWIVIAGSITLMSSASASAQSSPAPVASSESIMSQATLTNATKSAWMKFKSVYRSSGMVGLVSSVQSCYEINARKPRSLLTCLQLDYFSHDADVAVDAQLQGDLNPQTSLRTPYFSDDLFSDRRRTYTIQLAGDRANNLSAALLIISQNEVRQKTGDRTE